MAQVIFWIALGYFCLFVICLGVVFWVGEAK